MSKEILTLSNTTDAPIAFKVKTTSPKQYCVRPNAGIVKPSSTTEIHVILQPMRQDPPADFKCKDKFLVQSCEIPENMTSWPAVEVLAAMEKEEKDKIVEKKLKCVFLEATKESLERAKLGDAMLRQEVADSSMVAESSTAAVPASEVSGANGGSDEAGALRAEVVKLHDIIRQLRADADKKQRELEDARIALKRRTTETIAHDTKVAVKHPRMEEDGVVQVPVQTVAIVAFLAFLIGYLFF